MPKTLKEIKDELECKIGQEIEVIAQAGRKKIIKRSGKLSKTYQAVFVVDLNQEKHDFERVSFSYTDVLTNNIEINF